MAEKKPTSEKFMKGIQDIIFDNEENKEKVDKVFQGIKEIKPAAEKVVQGIQENKEKVDKAVQGIQTKLSEGDDKPKALKVRQGIQELMTGSRELMFDVDFDENKFELVKLNIGMRKLDPVFDGYKIVNLCDIHLGQWMSPKIFEGVVDSVNSLKPDLITLTGDYVSYILDKYEKPLEHAFKRLKAKDAKVAVLGNHDHWLGEDKIRNILKKSDIIDVSNDVYTLKRNTDKGERMLNIAGVDSYMLGKDNIQKVLKKLPTEGPAILLAHEPDFASISSKTKRFTLQISGHSHGGQFIIPGTETTLLRGAYSTKYPVGKYKVGNMLQYTSKGLGTNVFWMRINCKAEITEFTLQSQK